MLLLAAGGPLAAQEEAEAPVITSDLEIEAVAGDTFTYQISADNQPTGFGAQLEDAPGVTLEVNPATGALSGSIPENFTAETFSIRISASNAAGDDERELVVRVLSGDPPVITSASDLEAAAGTVFAYQITADNQPASFEAQLVGAPGVTLEVNRETGALSGSIPANFARGDFYLVVSAVNRFGRDDQEVLVTVESGEAPVITSDLEIEAVAGTVFTYRITAENNPDRYDAQEDHPDVELLEVDETTGRLRVRIAPGFEGEDFAMTISAANDYGIDEQEVTVTVLGRGPAQTLQAQVAVRVPSVIKSEYELQSTFSFRGTLHTEGQETAGRKPGTFSAPINTRRITNKQILELMKDRGDLESVAGIKLVMLGDFGDNTAALTAVNRKQEIFEPVPEEILAVRFGEDDQRITAYAGKQEEGEPVITRASGYEHVVVDWRNEPDTTTRIRLTGIGKFSAKRKSVVIEGDREVYDAYTRSANAAGFNPGYNSGEDDGD